MRKDMSKVIVERERIGGKWSRTRKHSKNEYENAPTKEAMRRRHTDRKMLNENLQPLKRYLESQLGKKWDNVFSDICANLRLTSAVQKHVRDHVFDFVNLNVHKEAQGSKYVKVYSNHRRWGGERHEIWFGALYVDPEDGILKKYRYNKRKRHTRREKSPLEVLNEALAKISGRVPLQVSEDGQFFKVYIDKVTEKEIREPAQAHHARLDFSAIVWFPGLQAIEAFSKTYGFLDNPQGPYWREYRRLVDLARRERDFKKKSAEEVAIHRANKKKPGKGKQNV